MKIRSWGSSLVLISLLSATSLAAQTSTKTYTYDSLGRLIIQENDGGDSDGETHSLCYDEAGNRTNYKTTDDGTQSTCVDDGDSGSQGGSGGGGDPPPPPPPPSNNPPVTVNDSATVFCDSTLTVNLTANDSDPEGNTPLVLQSISGGGFSSATVVSASSVSVSAGPVDGSDTYIYVVADSLGATSTGQLWVTVVGCGGGF